MREGCPFHNHELSKECPYHVGNINAKQKFHSNFIITKQELSKQDKRNELNKIKELSYKQHNQCTSTPCLFKIEILLEKLCLNK